MTQKPKGSFIKTVMLLGLVAAAATAISKEMPALRRYLKIKTM